MAIPIPLSWSRINVFRNCPKQFEAKYISKDYPDESDNPNFARGNKIHKQLEEYVLFKKGKLNSAPLLSAEGRNGSKIIESILTVVTPDKIEPERQIALDHDWEPVSWFSKPNDVRFRGIIDLLVFESPTSITIIDWKTGKVRDYDEDYGQLHLTASFLFELYPDVLTIDSKYCFVDHKQTVSKRFVREDHKSVKAKFDIEYIEVNEVEDFSPKKNSYCFFCMIKKDCKYG